MLRLRYHILSVAAAILAVIAAACSNSTPSGPPKPAAPDTTPTMLTFRITTVAGARPLVFDSVLTTTAGAEYRVTLFRYYVALPVLMDTAGHDVPVELLDSAGSPLKYGVQLVDFSRPESQMLRVKVPPGVYRGLAFTIGVPPFDSHGTKLNHADASVFEYPLDVDADMYWGWNPGYVFLKIEGTSSVLKKWEPFYYHVGEDRRMMRITTTGSVDVRHGDTSTASLKVDINRLFVTPTGENRPNIVGGLSDRVVNSGEGADIVSQNARSSGFIVLE